MCLSFVVLALAVTEVGIPFVRSSTPILKREDAKVRNICEAEPIEPSLHCG